MLLPIALTLTGIFVAGFLVLLAGLARAAGRPMPASPWALEVVAAPVSDFDLHAAPRSPGDDRRRDADREHRLHLTVPTAAPVIAGTDAATKVAHH